MIEKKLSKRLPGQILVVTLIILLLVSITVVTITITVAKNNRQVFNNIEYERSYNFAESRLVSSVEVLADPTFDLFELLTSSGQRSIGAENCYDEGDSNYYCIYTEEGGGRKTILRVEETNSVEAYEIGSEEYFDIVLFGNDSDSGYRRTINLKWFGESAIELTLFYIDSSGLIRSAVEIVDPEGLTGNSQSGFLNTRIQSPSTGAEGIQINLADLDTTKVPTGSKLRYLRAKSVGWNLGTVLTIRPDAASLPDQVRRVEVFSYLDNSIESSAPVIYTQLPLSPPTPSAISQSLSYHSVTQPLCGNAVKEGYEACDDGNQSDADSCTNKCEIPFIPVIGNVGGYGPATFIYKAKGDEIAATLRRFNGKVRNYVKEGVGLPEGAFSGPNVIYVSYKNTVSPNAFINYVTQNPNNTLTIVADSGDQAKGVNSVISAFGLKCDGSLETGTWKRVKVSGFGADHVHSISACRMTGSGTNKFASMTDSSRCVMRFGSDATGDAGSENGWCAYWIIKLNNGSSIRIITTYDMLAQGYDDPETADEVALLARLAVQRVE